MQTIDLKLFYEDKTIQRKGGRTCCSYSSIKEEKDNGVLSVFHSIYGWILGCPCVYNGLCIMVLFLMSNYCKITIVVIHSL